MSNTSTSRTEKTMSKYLIATGAAVIAAAVTAFVPAAQAGFHGGKSFHFGGSPRMSGLRLFRSTHHHFHHRRIIVTPVYTQPYRVVRPAPMVQPVIQKNAATVRYADGMGRIFDPSSGVWHDGANHCWAGKFSWTFRSGSWFYGSYRWYPSEGTWLTNAPEAPAPVDCQTVPAFAGKPGPTAGQPNGQKELGGYADQGEPAGPGAAPSPMPVKTAEKGDPAPAQPGGASSVGACKKYFPNLGEMLPVPCTN
jgi:hypothetical protein